MASMPEWAIDVCVQELCFVQLHLIQIRIAQHQTRRLNMTKHRITRAVKIKVCSIAIELLQRRFLRRMPTICSTLILILTWSSLPSKYIDDFDNTDNHIQYKYVPEVMSWKLSFHPTCPASLILLRGRHRRCSSACCTLFESLLLQGGNLFTQASWSGSNMFYISLPSGRLCDDCFKH